MNVALVVPLKSFSHAKARLAGALDPGEREELAKRCAETVLAAAGPWRAYVACDDDDVDRWAGARGARVVRTDSAGPGLDAAVAAAVRVATDDGADHVVVAHGDLPLARTFAHVPVAGAVSVVGDRHRDGTNVLAFPVPSAMTTAYGPGSLERHRALAVGAGLVVVDVVDDDLALDLDTADDLADLRRLLSRTDSGSAG